MKERGNGGVEEWREDNFRPVDKSMSRLNWAPARSGATPHSGVGALMQVDVSEMAVKVLKDDASMMHENH